MKTISIEVKTFYIRIRIRNIYWPEGVCFAHDNYHVLVATVQHPIIMLVQATVAHSHAHNYKIYKWSN